MNVRKRDLAARVLEHAQVLGLFPAARTVLVAVSGGADSIVLLDCLMRIRAALRISLAVAHVDHGLRASSAEDARFVEDHARRLSLPVVTRTANVRAEAQARGWTLEQAAREVRYRLLREMALETSAAVVATGHTATDQAETVLMRLVRGTGLLGLAAILPGRSDGFVRPLLCATRAEVRRYARSRRLPFREDPTNRDRRFLRNRIRLSLLPALRRLNPRIEFALSELAADAHDLHGFLERRLSELSMTQEADGVRIPREVWRAMDADLRPYAVLHAFHEVSGAPLGLARAHVDAVVRLADERTAGPRGEVHLPRGVVVSRDPDGLFWKVVPSKRPGSRS